MVRVLFVCLGNICRSPMADAIFRELVSDAGLHDRFEIDSAGTGSWHVGQQPHPGTRRVLAEHGVQYRHKARQVSRAELNDWDYIIALDDSNLSSLKPMPDGFTGELGLLLDYAPQAGVRDVPDPYYTGKFEEAYALVEAGCRGLLSDIREQAGW